MAACRRVGYNVVANLGLNVTMRSLHVDSTLQQAVVPLLLENNFQSPPQDVPKGGNNCTMLVRHFIVQLMHTNYNILRLLK